MYIFSHDTHKYTLIDICTYVLVFDSIIIIFDDNFFLANLPTSFFAAKKNVVVGIAPELPETYDGSQQGAGDYGTFFSNFFFWWDTFLLEIFCWEPGRD